MKQFHCIINIISVEILENGNYKIKTHVTLIDADKEEDYFDKQDYVCEYEITSNYKIISCIMNGSYKTEVKEEEKYSYRFGSAEICVTFEYNVIEEDYINSLIEEAESKDPTN